MFLCWSEIARWLADGRRKRASLCFFFRSMHFFGRFTNFGPKGFLLRMVRSSFLLSLSTGLHFPDPFDWGSFSVFLYFGIGNPVWDFLSNLHSFALSGSCSIDEVILHPSQGSQFLVFGGVGGGGLVLGFISRNGLCR